MRMLLYLVLPLLVICALIASRFVSWDSLKGEDPEALKYVTEGTALLQQSSDVTEFLGETRFLCTFTYAPYRKAIAHCDTPHGSSRKTQTLVCYTAAGAHDDDGKLLSCALASHETVS